MAHILWDLPQGSLEHMRLRALIPTSSNFHRIMTPKKLQPSEQRWDYMMQILASRLMNWQPESLDKIEHIADGKRREPLAVARLEMLRNIKTRPVGFVMTNDKRWGASPDRAVSASNDRIDICVEVKSPTPPIMFEYLLQQQIVELKRRANPKAEEDEPYICQRQGHLLVCEADKAIFHASNPFMEPECTVEQGRNEFFIGKLKDCLNRFSDELEELDLHARKLGAYQAVAEFQAPLDAEYADELRGGPAETPF